MQTVIVTLVSACDDGDEWQPAAGYPHGFEAKVLSGGLDEQARSGAQTRLLRIAPGAFSTRPCVHEFWTEAQLLSGDLIVGNDARGKGGTRFSGPTYVCRAPGVAHGPYKSDRGCVLFEKLYFRPG